VEVMSGQDTGKFREVGGAGHVETITSEDGRIEFVLEERGVAVPQLVARTAPQPAVVAVEASSGLTGRLRALPRWTWALSLAAAGVGLLWWAGSGRQERVEAEQEPVGFRAYGGGPVEGQGARVRSAAPPRGQASAEQSAGRPAAMELGEGEQGGEELNEQGLGAVRQAMPVTDVPPAVVPSSAFRSQGLGTMNPGLTEEQRKLLQVNAPIKPLHEEVRPPLEEPAPEVLQEPQPALEDHLTEQPAEPRGELLPNGGYQEGLEGRDPDTIAPPVPTDPALNYPATAQPE
jgi:hypothetical protein